MKSGTGLPVAVAVAVAIVAVGVVVAILINPLIGVGVVIRGLVKVFGERSTAPQQQPTAVVSGPLRR